MVAGVMGGRMRALLIPKTADASYLDARCLIQRKLWHSQRSSKTYTASAVAVVVKVTEKVGFWAVVTGSTVTFMPVI